MGTRESLLKKKYPSKLLLFGEHLVLDGASSIAVPFPKFQASWTRGVSNESLEEFYDYVSVLSFIDLSRLKYLRENGYYLKSNIPRGYGLGSSGALCAAVYEYTVDTLSDKPDYQIVQEIALLENFFHGKSSGLDAYVILKNEPIYTKGGIPKVCDINFADFPFEIFLIDSGVPRKSKSLIGKFRSSSSKSALKQELIDLNESIVNDLLIKNYDPLLSKLQELSKVQFRLLDYMIIDQIKPIWKRILDTQRSTMKLCGAGGGGYYLGFGERSDFNMDNEVLTIL